MTMSNEFSIHGGTAEMAIAEVQKGPKFLKMTLDQYLDFLHSDHSQFHLSPYHLRQILLMHGFKWMKQVPKEGRTEAARAIELTEPARSTITTGNTAENVSSRACITLAEAIKDLSLLQWQECCVTSLQTLNSTASTDETNHNVSITTTFASPTSSTKKKSKSKKKPNKSSSSSSKKTDNPSASTPTAASAVTNHSDPNQPPRQQQLEMEPPRLMLCDVDPGDVSSALVVLPAKRKKKGIREIYNSASSTLPSLQESIGITN